MLSSALCLFGRRQGEFHGLRAFDLLRGIQQLDGNEPSGLVVIENQAWPRLIAFGDFAVAEDDRQGIGLFVVDDFHGDLQYFAILLVEETGSSWRTWP